ncbi:hypothetical protein ACRALDRAFT_2038112 [Sodiomyces alcalophilus JCM 7366]|uniref:uncharacterized protein n=1 Tax=Sodiomyces alcalophilus JCM 7366 TaxID=591952 RepID=UPI0039B6551F
MSGAAACIEGRLDRLPPHHGAYNVERTHDRQDQSKRSEGFANTRVPEKSKHRASCLLEALKGGWLLAKTGTERPAGCRSARGI